MDTKIKCRNCGYKMDFGEYFPYVEVYLGKLAIETGLAALFLAALKNYFSSPQKTRGVVNGHMAHYAGILGIKCPECKELDRWAPVSEEDTSSKIKNKNTTKKQNSSLTL